MDSLRRVNSGRRRLVCLGAKLRCSELPGISAAEGKPVPLEIPPSAAIPPH
jgi:hypothetical protein